MSNYIERDIELLVTGKTAKFNDNVYLFKGDRDIQLNITVKDTDMKFSRVDSNILTPLPKDCYARVGIIKPDGTSIIKDRVPIIDNIVRLVIEGTLIDELEEMGEHKLQIRIYAKDEELSPRWTLPAATGLMVMNPDVDFNAGEMGRIRFDILSIKDLGTLYKDNSVDVDGLEFIAELNLNDVEYILANYVVNSVSYSDTVTIQDIENGIIRVPFKRDVLPAGEHQFEVIARMKNGDVKPSQTFKYKIEKSLENPDSVQADTNYPILIQLIDTVRDVNVNVNKLISDTKIDLQNYKETKNSEINQDLSQYKMQTTEDINSYKSAKDVEIDQYKSNKDAQIDNYVADKNKEIDSYKNTKDTLINEKLSKVETSETNRVEAETLRQQQHESREQFLNGFESQLEQIETKNIEQDNRLKDIEHKNKVQDVYINGLFNENADGRLTIEGEGNSLKLEGSKEGLVEVEKVVGNTLVNIMPIGKFSNPSNIGTGIVGSVHSVKFNTLPLKPNTIYTSILFNVPNTLSNYWYHKLSVEGKITGKVAKFTTVSDISVANSSLYLYSSEDNPLTREELDKIKIIILEGDYTNKPIPNEYFEGMQSTFEDKLITQDMVESGEELAENLGKYKCNVRVVGKNLANELINYTSYGGGITDTVIQPSNNNDVKGYLFEAVENKQYNFSKDVVDTRFRVFFFTENPIENPSIVSIGGAYADNFNTFTTVSPKGTKWGYLVATGNYSSKPFSWCQIEEGTVATQYEPYKEYKTSVYLNSPLTKFDEICVQNGQLGVLRGGESTILDGTICTANGNTDVLSEYIVSSAVSNVYNTVSANNLITDRLSALYSNTEQCIFLTGATPAFRVRLLTANYSTPTLARAWLQTNPITVVYKLAEPYFEKISDDKFVSEIPNDATLHIDSVIPCQSVKASYTGNVPSVYGMEKNLNNVNDEQAMQNEIDNTTMLAVADVYEMLMPVATMSLNAREGGNKMVELYVVLIMRGLKTIDQVPSTIRPQVEEMLKQVQ